MRAVVHDLSLQGDSAQHRPVYPGGLGRVAESRPA